jgi:hypothetical protein
MLSDCIRAVISGAHLHQISSVLASNPQWSGGAKSLQLLGTAHVLQPAAPMGSGVSERRRPFDEWPISTLHSHEPTDPVAGRSRSFLTKRSTIGIKRSMS